MAVLLNTSDRENQYNVLLIGNNPIELNSIYENLIRMKDKKFITEIFFDVKALIKNTLTGKPSFILVDDNIGKSQIKLLIEALSQRRETEQIPITIIKNSNYGDSSQGADEFILKQYADGENLSRALLNSRRLRKSQEALKRTYVKNRKKLKVALGF